MIIRILGEGQYTLGDTEVDELNEFDDQLLHADALGDDAAFARVLRQLVNAVRRRGTPVAADALVSSDLVLPSADTELAEVRAMLRDDGLIPG
ncbi:hypothetical protein AB0L63_09515 [Nocardia sp. NPDC051990]|uniref:PspA-associated protein PspAA n=1 Tax=Nocardia sp. NPDC051990 TaxID=3155285 RepID=UPI00343437C9